MSVVVAIKENGKVYLGADSQVTKGGTRSSLSNKNNYKIWKVKDVENCIIGHVGRVRDANIIRTMYGVVSEMAQIKNRVDYDYVVRCVVPSIFQELKDFGYKKDDKYNPYMESELLFAYQDKLFVISQDGTVIEVDDCCAVGSGASEAIGSLSSTIGKSPEERIIKAIKASAAHDIYVDYPIVLSDTENTKFSVITEVEEEKYINNKKNKKGKA